MTTAVLATKIGMTQAWTTGGKRVAVTKCVVEPINVVAEHPLHPRTSNPNNKLDQQAHYFEVAYGQKKLKNMSKPLRSKLEKSGFSIGTTLLKGLQLENLPEGESPVGKTLRLLDQLTVGDVVKVQGTIKGRGFAGAVKRHGFGGVGGRTHGQSDRQRAVGSIGSGTTPGLVVKGKRMPGHYGVETQTISGLVVLYVNSQTNEVWLSGPIPGANSSVVSIRKTGDKREIELDLTASGIQVPQAPVETTEAAATQETASETDTSSPATTQTPEETK